MIKSLDIGKYIYTKLSEIGGFKVYPCIADNDAKLPFVIYKRTSLRSNGCKDGYYEDYVTISIDVVADKYDKSIEVARSIRETLEGLTDEYNGMEFSNVYLSSASETYTNNAFVQNLQFSFTIN